jgi:hypothetical protein
MQEHGQALYGDTQEHSQVLYGDSQEHGQVLYGDVQEHGQALYGDAQEHGQVLYGDAEGTKTDCSMCNQSLDVRSTTLLVRQYVGSRCTWAAMPETDAFDPKGDCYHTQDQK